MRLGLSSFRGRLAASVTAILGLGAVSGCSPRAVSDADRVQQPVSQPQPVIVQEPPSSGVTTFAIGEEDGNAPPAYNPPTQGYQPAPSDQFATTLAIGEEDGGGAYNPVPQSYQPAPDGQFATTLAIGEEDGSGPFPVEPNGGIGDGAGPIPGIGGVQGDFERIYIPPAQ